MRLLITLAALAAPALLAQSSGNPLSADLKGAWDNVKATLVKAAEKMPEENYSFQPTDSVRTYGRLVGHVADAHYLICGMEKGEKRELTVEKTKTSKADLVNALKESIAYCDAQYAALTDARAAESVKMFGRDRTRLGVLSTNLAHDMEHYGNMVTYLRMKNIVPPTSEPRK